MSRAHEVFTQNNGDVTKAYYAELEQLGPIGLIALNLFRAQKRSTAAKTYRRGKFKHAAYDVKNWSLQQLCSVLVEHGASRNITWGWKEDPDTPGFEWVLYVDLPQGQVSFHSATRGQGPEYPGDWDRQKLSQERILAFCDNVLAPRNADAPLRIPQAQAQDFACPIPSDVLYGIPAALGNEIPMSATGPFMNISREPYKKAEQAPLFPDVRKGD